MITDITPPSTASELTLTFAELCDWRAFPDDIEKTTVAILCDGHEREWPACVFFLKRVTRVRVVLKPREGADIIGYFLRLPFWTLDDFSVDLPDAKIAALSEELRQHFPDLFLPTAVPDEGLSIVIPSTGRSEYYRPLLASISAQTGAVPFEAVVVINPAVSEEELRRLNLEVVNSPVRFVNSDGPGVNRARNVGVAATRFPWIYFVDDDCRFINKYHLSSIRAELVHARRDTLIGGPYVLQNPTGSVSQAYHEIQSRWLAEGRHEVYGWKNLLGGNLLIHRQLVEKTGFDDSIQFGGAETDLICRLLRQGARGRLEERFAVAHAHHLSVTDLCHKAFLQGYEFERRFVREIGIPSTHKSRRLGKPPWRTRLILRLYANVFARGRAVFRIRSCLPSGWGLRREFVRAGWQTVLGAK